MKPDYERQRFRHSRKFTGKARPMSLFGVYPQEVKRHSQKVARKIAFVITSD